MVALDLDRTLIHAVSTIPEGVGSVVVETLDGHPLSAMTIRAWTLLERLATVATVTPVTTRSLDQYLRVRLPMTARWAIAANGGTVLADGRPRMDWSRVVARRVDAHRLQWVGALMATAAEASGDSIRGVTARDGLFVSALLVADVDQGLIAALGEDLAGAGWRLATSGRKLYALPHGLDKEAALTWVAERSGEPVAIAAGDSPLDAGMLAMAADRLCPRDTEIARHPGALALWVTPRPGPLGTEDLLVRALSLVADHVQGPVSDTGPVPTRAGALD